jgi:GTPase
MFTDRVKLKLVAGKGGNGVVAWRREKYLPKGGPTGGNGGRGGDVVLRATDNQFSLESLRNRRFLRAENGRSGAAERCNGKSGQSLTINLPCGTLVKDVQTGELIADLTDDGEELEICSGGHGGRGNATFKTARRRAPNFATPGREGQEREVEFELKLIADVGLVGFPNAGKSTLLSRIANVAVAVGAYPFTTLRPNLGAIEFEDYTKLVIADIPGIIGGASQNRGLGLEFLRHVERCPLLLFVLDASGFEGRDPEEDYRVLRGELEAYRPELLERPFLVVLNKCDIDVTLAEQFVADHPELEGRLFALSAKEGDLSTLTRALSEVAK